jgi:hypothetical protein
MPSGSGSGKRAARTMEIGGATVELGGSAKRPKLLVDGYPIDVAVIDGEYHSMHASMFRGYPSLESLAEAVVQGRGPYWRPGPAGHEHGHHDGGMH